MKSTITLFTLALLILFSNNISYSQVVISGLDNGLDGTLRKEISDTPEGMEVTILPAVLSITLDSAITINKNITITGDNNLNPIITTGGVDRIFNITSSIVVLNNLSLTDGAAVDGGGILIKNASVEINNCTITDCIANGPSGSGGAILNDVGGILAINDSEISGNQANRAGGGIEDKSGSGLGIALVNVMLNNNNAGVAPAAAAPGNGGGLHITGSGDAVVTNSTINNNTAALEGGGLWNGTGSMIVNGSNLSGNIASGNAPNEGGGAIFNAGGILTVSTASITDNTANGTAGSGGGILNDMGTLVVDNSMLSNNSAVRAGGAIEDNSIAGSILTLTNSTLMSNDAASSPGNGGGLHITGPGNSIIKGITANGNTAAAEGGALWNGSGLMLIDSSFIMNNTAEGAASDNGGGGVFNNGGSLIIQNGTTISGNTSTGASGSGGGLLTTDGVVLIESSFFDENSANRAGGAIEMINGKLTFSNSEMSDNDVDGTAGTAMPGNGGGFHISGMSDSVFITNSLIAGNDAASEGGGLWNQSGSVMLVEDSDITGNTASGDMATEGGGGIFNAGGALTVNNSTINLNVVDGASSSGGGILNDQGILTVTSSVLNNNIAVRAGGGIEDNSVSGNTLILVDTDLTFNKVASAPGNGGGLHITGPGNSSITNGIVKGNTASLEGGGIWNGSGTMIIAGTIISENIASGNMANEGGGGIFNAGGTLSVMDVTISKNEVDGASASGGGILNDMGILSISNTVIDSNTAVRAGGGIEDNSVSGNTLILLETDLTNNKVASQPGNGGGLHITGPGNSSLTDGSVTGNIASLEGGGLWNGAGTMIITGTLITGNTASGNMPNEGGGGIFNAGGTITIADATISQNVANGTAGSGGGILNDLGVLTISSTVIDGNTAVRAGGGIEDNSASGNTLILTDTELTNNTAASTPGNGGGLHITGPGNSAITDGIVSGNIASAEGGGLWNGSGTMIIDATTIDANEAQGAGADNGGGGVFNNGGTLTIQNNTIISNNTATGAAGSGGGLLSTDGDVVISNTTFESNSANRAGGAIELIDGDLVFNASDMTNNDVNGTAGTAAPGNGGGLHVAGTTGTISILNSNINNNEAAREGGGLWNQSGRTMMVTTSTIDGNSSFGSAADDGGAGIFNNGGVLSIISSTISNNSSTGTAASGGGVHNHSSGTVTILTSTVTTNDADGNGGGVYNNGDAMTINASTIAMNNAGDTGGGLKSDTALTIKNTIVALNVGGTIGQDVSGMVTSDGYNLIGTDDEGVFTALSTDIENLNPILGPLQDNGGSTLTHALLINSPAYNAGSPSDNFDDQIGQSVFDGVRDIGAYEGQEILTSISVFSFDESGIELYPNPSSGFATLELSADINNTKAHLYELSSGKLVSEFNLSRSSNTLYFDGINNGVYILKITSDESTSVQKFVLAK